jgi:hypothetical protein
MVAGDRITKAKGEVLPSVVIEDVSFNGAGEAQPGGVVSDKEIETTQR